MRRKVVVHDKMQRGYVYDRIEPPGRNFAPRVPSRAHARSRCCGSVCSAGKYMTDCRPSFPQAGFRRKALREPTRPTPELLRRQRLAVARDLAAQRLDSSPGSARLVPVVLPVLPRPPFGRRCATDPALAGDRAARRSVRKNCEQRDLQCRRRQRQALLHWAYDSRKL